MSRLDYLARQSLLPVGAGPARPDPVLASGNPLAVRVTASQAGRDERQPAPRGAIAGGRCRGKLGTVRVGGLAGAAAGLVDPAAQAEPCRFRGRLCGSGAFQAVPEGPVSPPQYLPDR